MLKQKHYIGIIALIVVSIVLGVMGSTMQMLKSKEKLVYSVIVLETIFCVELIFYVHRMCSRQERYLERLAYFDQLTGLQNYNALMSKAPLLLEKGKREGLTIISFDIIGFQTINEQYGFEYANSLLRKVAQEAEKVLKNAELLCRKYADYFVAVVKTEEGLQNQLEYLIQCVNAIKCSGTNCVDLMIGLYQIAPDEQSMLIAIDKAECAKVYYRAQEDVNHIYRYSVKLGEKRTYLKMLEQEMNAALEKQEFKVYFQPKFDLKTEKLAGAEALVRWEHPKRGQVSPGVFIPLFERNGFIKKMDFYVLREICGLIKKWQSEEKEMLPISINFSRVYLEEESIADEIEAVLENYSVAHDAIEIEITESAALQQNGVFIKTCQRLSQKGFTIAIDDFGAGYSCLNVLKDLSIQVLKLDKEFFSATAEEEKQGIIIESIVEMAHELKMIVVAEGIETLEQLQFLKQIQCDIGQGYLLAKPMPVEEYVHLISTQKVSDNK